MDLVIVERKIRFIREKFVILDSDLAILYNVSTKVLNQAVKRNRKRFPEEFMFQVNDEEWEFLRSQFVTLDGRGKFSKYLPKVFTEFGVVMLASVLKSEIAIDMNINIVKAFIKLKEQSINFKNIEKMIDAIEKKYDTKFEDIEQVLIYLLNEKKSAEENNNRDKIGFIK
jgi:hypothetical protein